MKVMFYVQHLLGIGHIRRAALLSDAMQKQGLDVTVVLGGRDVPGIDFPHASIVRLPQAHVADHHFNPLLDETRNPVDEAWKECRGAALLAAFMDIRPDVLLFEMYPFGRRQFRFELLPLLEAAAGMRPKPLIVSSIRDILVSKPKPGRNQEITDLVHQYFDRILVHADPTFVRLEETFPEARQLGRLIDYTGFITAPDDTDPVISGNDEVIVSAGGGAVGGALLKAALMVKDETALADKTWRFVTGPNLPDEDFNFLQNQNVSGVIIERYRPDLPQMLGNCSLSISQGGYNTIMDLLRGKAKAVVVPYDEGGESEQLIRARLLAKRNLVHILESKNLTTTTLVETVQQAIQAKPGSVKDIDTDGAQKAARLIAEYCFPEKKTRGVHA